MAARMRTFDWASHPLGPPEQWPHSLRIIVRILLTSRYAMWMGWGKDLTFFYNDSYRPTLGIKDEWALGAPAREVWAEIWPDIGPRIDTVISTGKATWDEALRLFLKRSGAPEETYHTFSYSPAPNDEGGTGGMLCVVTEETERVIGERRLAFLRELASEFARSNNEEELLAAVEREFTAHPEDVPFAMIYLFSEDGESAALACRAGIDADHPLAAPRLRADDPAPALPPLAELHRMHEPLHVRDFDRRVSFTLPRGRWDRPPRDLKIVPLLTQGGERPAGFLVAALNPYRPFDDDYRGFIRLLGGQISAGLSNARAYAAERRRAEALAELDRAKTEFFSNVSHEFRTPLTLMLGPLEEELRERPDRRERLEAAHRNSLRLLKLVNSLLDFSRIEAGRMQAAYVPTDLGRFTAGLASAFDSVVGRAGLRLVIDCPSLGEATLVDRGMWEKIVFNLVSNAFKFTFAGEIEVRLRLQGEWVELSVRDTGTGIPAAELPKIFERFHRVRGARSRSHEGTGIGLALVNQLVRLHGGEIDVTSEEGKGTEFRVRLRRGTGHLHTAEPASEGDAASSAGAAAYVEEAAHWLPEPSQPELPPEAPAEGPRARILLADDNADMRNYVTRLLARQHDVVTVSDGEAALAAIQERVPDLVLSDVMMPRLDGFGLVRRLRGDPRTETLPVILLSARAGEDARIEGLGEGADDYLIKPFSARELLARVRTHLGLARIRRDAAERVRKVEEGLRRVVEEQVAERTAKLQETIAELESFSYSISHDLRAPLRAMQSFAQLLSEECSPQLNAEGRDYLRRIIAGSGRMDRLIQDVLVYSRVAGSDLALGPVPLQPLVDGIVESYPQFRSDAVDVLVARDLPVVRGNDAALTQCVSNLLGNALKFVAPGVRPRVEVSAESSGGWVRLRFKDNGIGIAPEMHGKIFGIFERLSRSYEGTGIGLAVVRKAAERMGGRVTLESAPGQGSTFCLELPAFP
ncbi:MAG TPA: ATP-binding protein [Opitutaceae bacterium]|jgi:signal transduction histidine kinase|nr:ATP-binding protein [Opitutaceae bacterium]